MEPEYIIRNLMKVIDDHGCCSLELLTHFKDDPMEKTKLMDMEKFARRSMNEAKAFLSSKEHGNE